MVAGLAVTALMTGCGGAATTASPSGAAAPPSSITIEIRNFAFNGQATVHTGGTVTWHNADQSTHTATSVRGGWDSGNIAPGGTYMTTLATAGTYDYMCDIHQYMKAQVTVSG